MALCFRIILLSLFVPFHPIYAQISSNNELQIQNETTILSKLDTKINEMKVQMHATPLQKPENVNKTDVVSYKDHTLTWNRQRHFQNAYGILILIGWGTLLPIGVIIARYFRKFPVMWCEVWYKCHIMCQTLGYILGTVGWCIGLWFGKSSKHFVSKTQIALSIIAFTFINVQMLATLIRPHKEGGYIKCWNICHHLLGYAIIGIAIANTFVMLHNQSQGETFKRVYVVILGVLALVVVPLEIFRCKTVILLQGARLTRSMFTSWP